MKNANKNFRKRNFKIFFLVPYVYKYYKKLQKLLISFVSIQQKNY